MRAVLMRFLHTADWHVGKPLRGRSRMDEYAAALEQVAGIAIDRKVDAVLVAGDVFDSPAPPPEAEKLVYDFLARLLRRAHRLRRDRRQPRPPAEARRARVPPRGPAHPRPARGAPARPGRRRARSPRATGRRRRAIAVLPFVPERKVVDACTVMDAEHKWYEAYASRIEQILAALVKGLPGHDASTSSSRHLLVDGARVGTGERELHLGQVYGVNPQQLPVDGPVHRPRPPAPAAGGPGPREDPLPRLARRARLRRAGAGQERRRLRGASRSGRPASSSCPITAGRRLRTVEGTLDELAAPRRREKRRLPARPREGRSPHARPRRPRQGAAPERPRRDGGPPARRQARNPSAARAAASSPRAQLFAAYYEHRNQTPPPAELQQLFDALHEEAVAGEAAQAHGRRLHLLPRQASSSTSRASTSSPSPARPAPASRP